MEVRYDTAEIVTLFYNNGDLSTIPRKAGLHVRRKHKHRHKHKHEPRVNRDDASTIARSFFLRLCLRLPGSHVAYACVCARACACVPVHTWLMLVFVLVLVLASFRFTRGLCLRLCLCLRRTCKAAF